MRSLRSCFLLILMAAVLSACGGGGSSRGGEDGTPSLPTKKDTPDNPAPPPRPEKPQNPLGLTEWDIQDIGRGLNEIVHQGDWETRSQAEKKTLIGAWLFQATEIVKPLDWEKLPDEEATYLINLYFDENLYFKRKGN